MTGKKKTNKKAKEEAKEPEVKEEPVVEEAETKQITMICKSECFLSSRALKCKRGDIVIFEHDEYIPKKYFKEKI